MRITDDDKQLFGTGDRGVQNISRQQTASDAVRQGEHDRVELTALCLVDSHRIRKLQLPEHVKRIVRDAVVKPDEHALIGNRNADDLADVAVEHAASDLVRIVLLLPHDVIVVAHLHDLVSEAENRIAVPFFRFELTRRIERLLQHAVELLCTGILSARRGEHLNLRGLIAVKLGEAGLTQLDDGGNHILCAVFPHDEEIAVPSARHRHFAVVDGVGVAHNRTLLCLTEDLIEFHRVDALRADAVAQEVARSDRRQLIRVTDQNQTGART